MNFEALDAKVNSYRDDIIKTMRRWLSVPSINAPRSADNAPFGAEVRKMLDLALSDARDMGFETREFDGYCMHAEMGAGEKTMGILCHLDVVPAGDGWTHDPWGGEVCSNRIFGRGVVDDKGAAVLAMYAMRAVRDLGVPLNDSVRLILGCDEETGMTDMQHYAEHCDLPDYGFSPDAEFPVINIEKGGLSLTLGCVTGGEGECDIQVNELYAGVRQNVVPGTAYAVLNVKDEAAFLEKISAFKEKTGYALEAERLTNNEIKLTATGKSAHASMPYLGLNAAGILLIALSDMNAGGGSNKAIKALAEKLGIQGDGLNLGIACSDELSGALTCNLGILRYDGTHLEAMLDIRYPLCANETEMCGAAVKSVSDAGMYVRLRNSHKPHHVPAEHKVVKGLIDVYSEATGTKGYSFAIGGGTYSRCMPNTVAFGLTFPNDEDPCHMPDEYIDLDKMMLSARIMARAIAELAGKK